MNKKGIIQKLKDRFEKARIKRLKKEAKEQPFKDRLIEIFSAPRHTLTDFYCLVCKKDCSGTGYRQVCTIRKWVPTAWYIGTCPNGHKMIRRITDKSSDPYYVMSPFLQRQRYDLIDAFITPDDPRFKVLYPDKYAKLKNHVGKETNN
jgi:hypothetical protein|tara:strand:+ start:1441 stop:1884 length:444 start_codon:yes stop_codon:yes gene_type:complete